MDNLLDILNLIGVIAATIISAFALLASKNLQKMEQQVSIMAQKRSQRIDDLRRYSSDIVSISKGILHGLYDDIIGAKKELINAVDKFVSLLQYIYKYDIDLIDRAKKIEEIFLSDGMGLDKNVITDELVDFWKKCDLYVGVEYERLKKESSGLFQKSGDVDDEEKEFYNIYRNLYEKGTNKTNNAEK